MTGLISTASFLEEPSLVSKLSCRAWAFSRLVCMDGKTSHLMVFWFCDGMGLLKSSNTSDANPLGLEFSLWSK